MEIASRTDFIQSFMTSSAGYEQWHGNLTAFSVHIVLPSADAADDPKAEREDRLITAMLATLKQLDLPGAATRLSWRSIIGVLSGDATALNDCFAYTRPKSPNAMLLAVTPLPPDRNDWPNFMTRFEIAGNKYDPSAYPDKIVHLSVS
jgi:hypothetical protein